ncbi:MAG: polymer-forming cytoskeletal protein [Gammaproteobacteria bacterium]
MKIPDRTNRIFLLLLVIAALPALSYAQHAGEVIMKHGEIDDDLYLAGRQVDLYAAVNGDVIVAGGELNLEGDINADLMAAGGSVTLDSVVADDARLAGGNVRVNGKVGDDLLAAGGRIHLSPVARVGGRAWLSGGEVRVDGHVVEELRVAGGRVVIAGKVDGDVELRAEHIVIEESAEINGNLHYSSPHEADIASGVRIDGEVVYTPVDVDFKPIITQAIFAALLVLISIILTAVVLYRLFPVFCLRVSQSLSDEPWISLGIGLAVFAGVPVLMVVLFSTLIGLWLALLLLVLYLVILLAGYLAGALFVGSWGLSKLGKSEASHAMRATALAIALFALAVVNLVPIVGGLINWAVLLAGIGALSLQLYVMYRT